jgi:hypothetical protein
MFTLTSSGMLEHTDLYANGRRHADHTPRLPFDAIARLKRQTDNTIGVSVIDLVVETFIISDRILHGR